MRALVTGAAGFVGHNLAQRLLRDGHQVVGVDSLTDYYSVDLKRRNLAKIADSPDFVFVEADLLQIDLVSLLADIDVVFHQAGQPGVRKSWGADFSIYTRANVDVTQKLLEAATSAPRLKRFVYASSSSVYGDAERFPTTEVERPMPVSPYGVTKLAAEHLCTLYAKNFDLPTVSLRYFTVYGPGQRPDMAFTRFVRAVVENEPVTIYGTGEQIRDFTFIDDVVEANVLAASVDSTPGSIFNVAGGSSVSVNEVLETLSVLSGLPVRAHRIERALGDVFRTGGSTTAISEQLGWTPAVGIEEGLRRQLAWGQEVFAR